MLGVPVALGMNFFFIWPKRVEATLAFLNPASAATRFQSTYISVRLMVGKRQGTEKMKRVRGDWALLERTRGGDTSGLFVIFIRIVRKNKPSLAVGAAVGDVTVMESWDMFAGTVGLFNDMDVQSLRGEGLELRERF